MKEKTINTRFFWMHKEKGRFMFRLFGYGVYCQRTATHDWLFSEKYGKVSYIVVRGWLIKILT